MTDSAPVAPTPAPTSGGWGPVGKVRDPWFVILISIITLGIYFLYWTYQVFREMKEHSGQGVGGPIGLIIGIFVGFVNLFLIPVEIKAMYEKAGKPSPVTWVVGLWNLIPLVGFFIWTIKVQNALNAKWEGLA
jgi:Domain of unknown function (DUF4234)